MKKEKYKIAVSVTSAYVDEHSYEDCHVFAYDITIHNQGTCGAKLMSRYWKIVDGYDQLEEIKGPGVVGIQPFLSPGEKFQYSSSAMIPTPVGLMEGEYYLRADDGTEFSAAIPPFMLARPNALQ